MVSGLTASIALEQVGELKSGEVVLVTGARHARSGAIWLVTPPRAAAAELAVLPMCLPRCDAQPRLGRQDSLLYSLQRKRVRAVAYVPKHCHGSVPHLTTEYPIAVDCVVRWPGNTVIGTCSTPEKVRRWRACATPRHRP